ncbi:MAG TPA: Holliday junction resolvase RuvX [Candidatus Paceibacterota bacterium]|nr:Holliday junction resolvase RuvX [Candidatus Paceibacterota bacterium]
MRYLGIDYGTRKCGLALSDEGGSMGFPYKIIPNDTGLYDKLVLIIKSENVGAVVMGESKDLAGNDNAIANAARLLGTFIMNEAKVPVYYEPEMFTSAEARRARDESVTGRSPKSTDAVDASAAALILTSYLSKKHD